MRCVRIIFIVVFLFGIISCGEDKKDNKNEIKDELALLDVKIRQEPKNADLYYARSKVLLLHDAVHTNLAEDALQHQGKKCFS